MIALLKKRDQADSAVIRESPGVLYRVLSKLLLLDGERLSYRTLAVEQIGSVYEAIMGFELQVAAGKSIAIRPAKKHGAPATINLEELLRAAADKRMKWFTETTDQKLTGQAAEGLKTATTIEELLVALDRKIAKAVTPNVVPQEAMIFQPSNERRKSGSHYTPSSLTGPIVEAALEPVLKQLGENPKPEQILSLKICDPAMGSGAFLVEACRQLGDELMKAWHKHDDLPFIPADEEEALCAQRMVSQSCLYGVDKNPMAVDLAKLSLWLATLAKDHPFTFLDHSLRTGDSLVGLTRQQIATFHWRDNQGVLLDLERDLSARIERVGQYRQRILAARDNVPYAQLRQELDGAEESLQLARDVGDTVIAAFFSADKPKPRENKRIELRELTETALKDPTSKACDSVEKVVAGLRRGPKGVVPFHWELEFPEVFTPDKGSAQGGFNVIVGNPPFAGKNTLIDAHADCYLEWLKTIHQDSHGNSDLVAHFFRRAFNLLAESGCFGLIATNTIGQGDTRSTGLRWICMRGGTIYRARKRLKWPGEAAVVVSVVHVGKMPMAGPYLLDEHEVPQITAYLFHAGGHEDPVPLRANEDRSFIGSYILGMGFTFDDSDRKGTASPIAEMYRLIALDNRNKDRIFPYLGGDEINSSPTHEHHRYVIDFEDWPLSRTDVGATWAAGEDADRKRWLREGIVPLDYPYPVAADFPDLLRIVEEKVKPERLTDNRDHYRRFWWQFAEKRRGLMQLRRRVSRVLVVSRVTERCGFTWLPSSTVCAETVVVFGDQSSGFFATLQSQVHDVWARFFGSSLGLTLRYSPSDCFEPFPLPVSLSLLEEVGNAYYELRAELMNKCDVGLTTLYNWYHDPDCDYIGIPRLRELHEKMDRLTLDAYCWTDIQPKHGFIPEFDDEEDEDDYGTPKRKRYRYRWSDEVRDEVLARLLELNRQRALEEGQVVLDDTGALSDAKLEKTRNKKLKAKKTKQDSEADQITMNLEEA